MKEKQILQQINMQEEKNIQRMENDLIGILEREFVLTNVLKGYITYLSKNKKIDKGIYEDSMHKMLSQQDILVKKTNGYDISKHNFELAMYMHKHTYFELDYVYHGSCEYYIDNPSSVFTLKEKELCIVNPQVIHGINTKRKDDIVFKCFIPTEFIALELFEDVECNQRVKTFFEQSLNGLSDYTAYLVIEKGTSKNLEKIMFQMFEEFIEKKQGWNLFYQNYLSLLFLELTRIKESHSMLYAKAISQNHVMKRILDCIQKNYPSITLKDLASDFHFNENYLSRKIKHTTNKSFQELLSQYKLLEAEQLLLNTKLTVGEISSRVGYDKPSFFYKLFKEHYGVTPMEFKQKRKEI